MSSKKSIPKKKTVKSSKSVKSKPVKSKPVKSKRTVPAKIKRTKTKIVGGNDESNILTKEEQDKRDKIWLQRHSEALEKVNGESEARKEEREVTDMYEKFMNWNSNIAKKVRTSLKKAHYAYEQRPSDVTEFYNFARQLVKSQNTEADDDHANALKYINFIEDRQRSRYTNDLYWSKRRAAAKKSAEEWSKTMEWDDDSNEWVRRDGCPRTDALTVESAKE